MDVLFVKKNDQAGQGLIEVLEAFSDSAIDHGPLTNAYTEIFPEAGVNYSFLTGTNSFQLNAWLNNPESFGQEWENLFFLNWVLQIYSDYERYVGPDQPKPWTDLFTQWKTIFNVASMHSLWSDGFINQDHTEEFLRIERPHNMHWPPEPQDIDVSQISGDELIAFTFEALKRMCDYGSIQGAEIPALNFSDSFIDAAKKRGHAKNWVAKTCATHNREPEKIRFFEQHGIDGEDYIAIEMTEISREALYRCKTLADFDAEQDKKARMVLAGLERMGLQAEIIHAPPHICEPEAPSFENQHVYFKLRQEDVANKLIIPVRQWHDLECDKRHTTPTPLDTYEEEQIEIVRGVLAAGM